ncbi:hypothetical protein N1851_007674 [Merluccius polli]|uniref:Uncharacterized protein n=1 Tax=Merluccius polli TaxID=89951 RepID=A0AA47N3U4_MERPO|nr:hypothetical protein N1851_007674 [Merluccius polli]
MGTGLTSFTLDGSRSTLGSGGISLRAKTDELSANTRYLHEYWSACVLAITETWLDSNIKSSEVKP